LIALAASGAGIANADGMTAARSRHEAILLMMVMLAALRSEEDVRDAIKRLEGRVSYLER
jgi:hypothetical protein